VEDKIPENLLIRELAYRYSKDILASWQKRKQAGQ
jgi:hypothetical protein